METKFLVSLILLQAIFNNANLIIPPDRQIVRCGKNGDFSSELIKERDNALDRLEKRLRQEGPFHVVSGDTENLWSTAVCPPNAKREDCIECVKKTIPTLKKKCPKQKEGAGWSVAPNLYCMAHYADTRKMGLNEWVLFSAAGPLAPGTASELEKGLNNLGNKLKDMVTITSKDNYGSGSISYGPGSHTLYGSMQCAKTSKENCKTCLSEATNQLNGCCSKLRKPSGMAFFVNCSFWYATYNFLPKTIPTIISVTPPHVSG